MECVTTFYHETFTVEIFALWYFTVYHLFCHLFIIYSLLFIIYCHLLFIISIVFTEEVLRAMMAELNKYGCQLPQFGKIGGILASELPVDEATLHAAVIAVNDAIDKAVSLL